METSLTVPTKKEVLLSGRHLHSPGDIDDPFLYHYEPDISPCLKLSTRGLPVTTYRPTRVCPNEDSPPVSCKFGVCCVKTERCLEEPRSTFEVLKSLDFQKGG